MLHPVELTVAQLAREGNLITDAKTLYAVGRQNGMTCKQVKETFITDELRISRGQYNVGGFVTNQSVQFSAPASTPSNPCSEIAIGTPQREVEGRPQQVANTQRTFADVEEVYIPSVDPTYVAWGEYATILTAVQSRAFFPIYISGMSGNGKTMMVEQACAKAKREYVRVQISPETDETDLIGGFRLIDGETVFYKGPVVKAMERGAVLLIDELDRGSNKILCLQGVLEGKPILLKKIGQIINPAPGFNVIATANTKGRGSEDGRYAAASIIDEAFIERFVATIDQPFPNDKIEKNIVLKHMSAYGVKDTEFADKLVAWSQVIRKTFENDGVEEIISTRRLCHIVKAFSIFPDRSRAIAMCIARFDEDTKAAFIDLYSKIDAQPTEPITPYTVDENGVMTLTPPDDTAVKATQIPF